MGQYYTIANVDKKEFIHPHAFEQDAKLMAFSYICDDGSANMFMSALNFLLSDRWKGDRVYVIGDYANCSECEKADKNFIPTMEKLYEEFADVGNVDDRGYETSLYSFVRDTFKELTHSDVDISFITPTYLCNSLTKEYINLRTLPIEWDYEDKNKGNVKVSIHPLLLLLAMGNGRGGGDYHPEEGSENIGKWVETSKGIFFAEEIPEGYKEFIPGFTEVSS